MVGPPNTHQHHFYATVTAHGLTEVQEALASCNRSRTLGTLGISFWASFTPVFSSTPRGSHCEDERHCSGCLGWPSTGTVRSRMEKGQNYASIPTASPLASFSSPRLPRLWKLVPQPRRMNCWQSAHGYRASQSGARTAFIHDQDGGGGGRGRPKEGPV